jgi:hypothetical protein
MSLRATYLCCQSCLSDRDVDPEASNYAVGHLGCTRYSDTYSTVQRTYDEMHRFPDYRDCHGDEDDDNVIELQQT